MNGSGKSSVLDATAILFSWLVNRIKHSGASGRPITEADIRNGEHYSDISLIICDGNKELSWSIAKVRKGYSRKGAASQLSGASEAAKQVQAEISEHDGHVNLNLFAYYPVNRAVLDIPLRIREKHSFDILSTYDESLTSGANFRTFFEWYREREDLENENRKYINDLIKPSDFQFPDPQLDAVRKALKHFMPDFRNLTVRRNPLRMEIEKKGIRITVNQLSDGEKCLMAMIGDLARRLAIANPNLENPLDGNGVILIDEVDLHLHPKWQRMVVPMLTEVFPNCQFLISTHSPHVINHVKAESLIILRMDEGELRSTRPSQSYGQPVERILEDLMGLETTRPDDISKDLCRIYQYIEEDKLMSAKDLIENLQSRIGADSELMKANVLIKRKQMIGK